MLTTVTHLGHGKGLAFSAALLSATVLMLTSLARTPLPLPPAQRAARVSSQGLAVPLAEPGAGVLGRAAAAQALPWSGREAMPPLVVGAPRRPAPAAGAATTPARAPMAAQHSLAHVIHDYPLQDIYAAMFLLEAQPRPTPESVAQVRATLARAAAQLRCICDGLHPAGHGSPCLVAALRNLVAACQLAEGGPTITLQLVGLTSLTLPASEDLFAIARGALVNALRHSQARRIELLVGLADNQLTLEVRDDGMGFTPPADLTSLAAHRHYGLAHMVERAGALGAQLRLETAPGRGTSVRLTLPLAA